MHEIAAQAASQVWLGMGRVPKFDSGWNHPFLGAMVMNTILTCVVPLVQFQIAAFTETLVTHITFEWFFSYKHKQTYKVIIDRTFSKLLWSESILCGTLINSQYFQMEQLKCIILLLLFAMILVLILPFFRLTDLLGLSA